MSTFDMDETPIGRAAQQAARLKNPNRNKLPRPEKCRKITIANQKGGVGKTTSTVNLAWSLSLLGMKVLVIDLDPQGNASTALNAVHHAGTPSSYEVLLNEMSVNQVMQGNEENENIFCVPATIDLAGAEISLVNEVRREYRLSSAIRDEWIEEHGFDYVFIDCPPSLGLLTINAMTAVDEVLIPIQCEYYALEGVSQLIDNIAMIRESLNQNLHISGVLLTMYDGRTRLSQNVSDDVRTHFGSVVLDNHIPRNVKVSEAPSYNMTVLQYDGGAPGALAYYDAAKEFAQRGDYLPTSETAPIGIAPELHNQGE
ncbi:MULTISPECIES: ParA family protein [unclassified Corynebacterium]|uniref:ParA family protein n=1 Tax=unclassified Corynebacterium TaxID=2624378 RepID=UPI001EF56AE0|nr:MULTISPECIES: ParA family protein [unclassified Corynebacterium]MCG7259244.1 ParA family protein [Corynebacterium sp. ACRQK]MCG7263543.1 ParA family protein [Corynebacterium sp. ACRQL]